MTAVLDRDDSLVVWVVKILLQMRSNEGIGDGLRAPKWFLVGRRTQSHELSFSGTHAGQALARNHLWEVASAVDPTLEDKCGSQTGNWRYST
jgi:hypothetical protein